MKTGIDFKKIAMTSVGQLGGLAVTTQLNRIPFVKKIEKPALKGTAMFAVGSLLVPFLAKAAGLNKKGNDDVVNGVGSAISVYGLAVLGNSFAPNIFPAITGVEGYEDSVYGMGLITEEDDISSVDGYEDGVYGPEDEDGVYGPEDEED